MMLALAGRGIEQHQAVILGKFIKRVSFFFKFSASLLLTLVAPGSDFLAGFCRLFFYMFI